MYTITFIFESKTNGRRQSVIAEGYESFVDARKEIDDKYEEYKNNDFWRVKSIIVEYNE